MWKHPLKRTVRWWFLCVLISSGTNRFPTPLVVVLPLIPPSLSGCVCSSWLADISCCCFFVHCDANYTVCTSFASANDYRVVFLVRNRTTWFVTRLRLTHCLSLSILFAAGMPSLFCCLIKKVFGQSWHCIWMTLNVCTYVVWIVCFSHSSTQFAFLISLYVLLGNVHHHFLGLGEPLYPIRLVNWNIPQSCWVNPKLS